MALVVRQRTEHLLRLGVNHGDFRIGHQRPLLVFHNPIQVAGVDLSERRHEGEQREEDPRRVVHLFPPFAGN